MLNILHEDNHIIVVEKPFNLLTQGDETGDDSLHDQIKEYIIEKYNKPGDAYLGLVHRLDRPARGLLVFAKTSKAASRLSEQVRVGEFTKKYICLSEINSIHEFAYDWKTLTHYLKKNSENNTTKVFDEPKENYKKSILEYQFSNLNISNQEFLIKNNTTNYQLISINLITGRSHQIRAQLAHIGLPVVGDIKYKASSPLPNKNIALIANYLEFTHPTTKERLLFTLF